MNVIVKCEHVTKSYDNLVAVNDVSFYVDEGEIFGLVGPNGAGKTTLIEMIESLRKPDSGSIRVLGLDPTKESNRLKEKIGVLLQTTSIQRNLKVKEAVKLFASLYQNASDNPEELLRTLSLEDKEKQSFSPRIIWRKPKHYATEWLLSITGESLPWTPLQSLLVICVQIPGLLLAWMAKI